VSAWVEGTSELEWYRRVRDAYSAVVEYGEVNQHLDELWLKERRRNNALLEEVRHVRSVAVSIGTMTGSIPVEHLKQLFALLEQHDKEMEEPF
jgi:hypothetical protein